MGDVIGGTTIEDLSRQLGRAPNATEVAAALNMDREDVIALLLAGRASAVPAIRCVEHSGFTHPEPSVDRYLATHATTDKEKLRPLLAALPRQQLLVMLLRFHDSLTHSQIAARTGLAQTQVARMLAMSLASLRDHL